MTNKEAIEWLPAPEVFTTNEDENHPDNKPWEAYRTAIDALKYLDTILWIINRAEFPREDITRYKLICELLERKQ